MKKFLITLTLMIIMSTGAPQAQTVTDSYSVGFGLSYPRYYSVNITSLNSNFGAYLSLQRNFSEHVGLRLKGGYSHLEGEYINAANDMIKQSTGLVTADLDLLFYIVPCAPLSPYLYAGLGANLKTINNPQSLLADNSKIGTQFNLGLGAEYKINPNWTVVAEFGYHITNNSELDGTIVPFELNGRDTYLVLSAGMNYYFGHGEVSKQCEPCQGITGSDMTNYNRIEEMIKRHIPKEVIKEVIVDKYIVAISEDRLVLVGVNFAFDKSDLLPESYPVLDRAVRLLAEKPDVNVEIEGYTDFIGTAEYNQTLSEERADVVRHYLIAKGIASHRLSTIGYGQTNPIADNTTDEGRAMNRRIVFRIIK